MPSPKPKSAKPKMKPKSAPAPMLKPKTSPSKPKTSPSKPKGAPSKPKGAPDMQAAASRLNKCLEKRCPAELATARVLTPEFKAAMASIFKGNRSDAEVKRMMVDTMVRAAANKPRVALTGCSVAQCKPDLVKVFAAGSAEACRLARAKTPMAKCIVPPGEKGLTVDAATRQYQAMTRQMLESS